MCSSASNRGHTSGLLWPIDGVFLFLTGLMVGSGPTLLKHSEFQDLHISVNAEGASCRSLLLAPFPRGATRLLPIFIGKTNGLAYLITHFHQSGLPLPGLDLIDSCLTSPRSSLLLPAVTHY